jgi:hypothetical protein
MSNNISTLYRLSLATIFTFASIFAGEVTAAGVTLDFARADAAPGNMRFSWIHGSRSAKHNTDVRVQVHRYNEHTYMLRQNPAIHWEAPFMYLLFGNDRAVLLDAGATAEAEYFPLLDTVNELIARWEVANGKSGTQLMVLPLGNDFSQIQGVEQFTGRPNTVVVEPGAAGWKKYLELDNKVAGQGELELGGRKLSVVATPGLSDNAISLYDPYSDLLFTGNSFYAGRLVIRDFDAYKSSLKRLLELTSNVPVHMILGGRIEMSDYPGVDYILRSNYRPREASLQLDLAALEDASRIVLLVNGAKDIRIHNQFIVMNGVGRGARDHGWPTYTPERFRQVKLR